MNPDKVEDFKCVAEARNINLNILMQCANVLRREGLQQIGIFRVSGSLTDVKRLWTDLYRNENIVLEDEDPCLLASLITWHLRQLSEPLIPFKLHNKIMRLELGTNESADILALKPLILDIPSENWDSLKLLMGLIEEISQHVEVNEMSRETLAQTFAPLLCRPPNTAYMSVRHVQSLKKIENVVLLMIVHHQEFFGTPRKFSPRSPRGALLGLSIEIPKAHHFVNPERSPAQIHRTLTASSDLTTLNGLISSTVSRLFKNSLLATSSSDTLKPHTQAPGLSNQGGVDDEFEGHPVKVHALEGRGGALPAGALERRKMVAACRALRAQLSFFEEGWAARRGRRPRGPERAHMASTYAQYRVWKRNIRDDAALQIQIFWRQCTRKRRPAASSLSNNQQHQSSSLIFSGINSSSDGETLVHPYSLDIGQQQRPSPQGHLLRSSSGQGPEGGSGGGSILPNINHKDQPPKSPIFSSNGSSSVQKSPFSRKTHQTPKSPTDDLAQLLEEKRLVKEKLKQFDLRFMHEKGRMPSKAEKEPIRHLYEHYNLTKNKIKKLELANKKNKKMFWGSGANSPQHSPNGSVFPPSEGSLRKSPHRATNSLSPYSTSPSTAHVSEIENLKRSKRELHIMLKNYERQFKQQHGREVSSPDDIAPVEREYQKYKEIKRKLMKLTAEK